MAGVSIPAAEHRYHLDMTNTIHVLYNNCPVSGACKNPCIFYWLLSTFLVHMFVLFLVSYLICIVLYPVSTCMCIVLFLVSYLYSYSSISSINLHVYCSIFSIILECIVLYLVSTCIFIVLYLVLLHHGLKMAKWKPIETC